MPIISHRGAKGLAPENTIESIKLADTYRPKFIEFDVRLSKDNQPVISHDLALACGTIIKHKTYNELKKIDSTVIRLDDVLANIQNSVPLIELKDSGSFAACKKFINRNQPVAFTTFDYEELKLVSSAGCIFFTMQRVHPFGLIKKALAIEACGVGINKRWSPALPYFYWRCQRNNLSLYIYTVNNVKFARTLQKLFPNIIICTDFPNRIN